ncbi:MAG: FecR domain-containing protein [Leptospiraceae bacterium]|nr:FecR domain-containing protein [Leptospiraceae bacterium]MCP5502112.1 FecR domain-containing protein [Leptospiraceae bacterium]
MLAFLKFSFISLSLFLFCSDLFASNQIAVVLFTKGKVFANKTKTLRVGDRISETDTISTGAKSSCEIQIIQDNSPVVIRLKDNAEFSLNSASGGKNKQITGYLKSGKALFNVGKGGNNLKIVSPTSVAGVRGTKFMVDAIGVGLDRTATFEGEVNTRARVAELESLENDVLKQNKALDNLVKTLEKRQYPVKQGSYVDMSAVANRELLDKTGISEALTDDKKAALSKKEFQERIAKFGAKGIETSLQSVDKEATEKHLEVFEELIPVDLQHLEDDKKFTKVLDDRNSSRSFMLLINQLRRDLREAKKLNAYYEEKLNHMDTSIVKERKEHTTNIQKLDTTINALQKQVQESKTFSENDKQIQKEILEHLKSLKEIEESLKEITKGTR